MACGFSPNLALMLEQMAQEKEKKALEAEQLLQSTTQHVARAKHKIAQVEQQQANVSSDSYDWTRSYERWDAWEDPEELARQEKEARERSERAAKAQMGCNHDHSAVRQAPCPYILALCGTRLTDLSSIHCCEQEQTLMDMTTQEKLTACDEFRRLGNLFFQHGQYQRAAYHYHKALVYFEYVFPETEDENASHDDLKLKVLLNFAACRLKTNHLDDVIHHADQALAIDEASVKALYRRAQALRLKDEFELSLQDISRAMELSTAASQAVDPLLTQERALLQARMLAYKLKSRQVSSAMFNAGSASDTRSDASSRFMSRQAGDLPDVSVLHLDLSKALSSSGAGDGNAPEMAPFGSWQPSTLGLSQLESALAKIDCHQT